MIFKNTENRLIALPLHCRICHIAVGTPGRICALLERGDLVSPKLKILVLDDAENLRLETFRDDIIWLLSNFQGSNSPEHAQVSYAIGIHTSLFLTVVLI